MELKNVATEMKKHGDEKKNMEMKNVATEMKKHGDKKKMEMKKKTWR